MELYFAPPKSSSVKKLLIYILLLGNIAGIVFMWWSNSSYYIQTPAPGNLYVALGRIAGLLAEYFILVQLILVGRVKWAEQIFGFDKLNKFHRVAGYSVSAFLLAHPLLLIAGKGEANQAGFVAQLVDFLVNHSGTFLAYIAFMLYALVIFLSIAIVRKKMRYEVWYFTHLLTYAAIGLSLPHQLGTGDLTAAPALTYWYILNFGVFGFVLLYRFFRPIYLYLKHGFVVAKITEESPGAWSIYVTGRNMESFGFQAGQYANINILSRGAWQTHPFSFSSAYNGRYLRFSIKNLGDYTAKIKDIKIGTHLIIDGPLGRFVEKEATREKYLCIAGGIGITPIRALAESLAVKGRDVALLYSSKTSEDIIFKNELDIIREHAPGNLTVHHVLSQPTPGFESGRIDKEKIIRLVPDFYSREVYICGPQMMMRAMVGNLRDLGFSPENLHYEEFSF